MRTNDRPHQLWQLLLTLNFLWMHRTLTPTEIDVLLAYLWAVACINLGALFVYLDVSYVHTLIPAPILTGSFIYGVQYLVQTHPIEPELYRP